MTKKAAGATKRICALKIGDLAGESWALNLSSKIQRLESGINFKNLFLERSTT
jgi:hypothetical protein